MTADRWNQIESLFAQALECPLPDRAPFLDRVCHGDPDLRRELESLLACDEPDQRLIEVPTALGPDESGSDMLGRHVGPYRILQLIGRGGMGAVYLGVRDDVHYQKQVAVKLLNRGMDTDFMLGRFRQERQILANLEHPFIARLVDGGATDDGLPYFVMEYVDGVPITKYCSEHGLSTAERLRLFGMVCEAVQHAHQNLVVHRDIKPGNILTTKEGIPKLLDFGIAKILDPALEITQTRDQRMLTPDYASPEQIKGLPVSTATDIYSLGAVLYELLTGRRPHRLKTGSLAEMENAVCVTEPLRPSTAAAANEDLPEGIRKQLRRELTGDLDNIILTALRKEPQRRYASAAEFAEDLRRHMEGLPVRAHEDRWTYRASKFVRRNRLAMGTAALVTISLIAGLVATRIQAKRAEQRFQIVRGLARTMLFDLYTEMERLPGSIELRAATLRSVVNYLDTLAHSGSHDPELDLEIATAYERVAMLEGNPFMSNLGHGVESMKNYRKALDVFERLASQSAYRRQANRGLIDIHLKLSIMESLFGNPKASTFHSGKATEIANAAFARGNSEVPASTQINVYYRLADLAYDHGDAVEELADYRRALEIANARAAAENSADALSSLAGAYRVVGSAQARVGDLAGAMENFRAGEKTAESLMRHPDARPDSEFVLVNIQTAIGDTLAASDDPNFGDRPGALERYARALAIAERLAAADPANVNAKRHAAAGYWRFGMLWSEDQPAKGLEYSRKALQLSEAVGSGDPQNVEYKYHASRAYLWMGNSYRNLHQHREAVLSLNRAVELQNSIEATSPQRIWNLRVLSRSYAVLGATQLEAGNPDAALVSLQKGLEAADRMLQRAPASLSHQIDRADLLEAMGRHYAALARSPGIGRPEKAEFLRQASSSYEGSLVIFRDWLKRGLLSPYAERRENSATAAIASLGATR